MKHANYKDVKLEIPTEEGVKDTKLRWLISKKDKAENFAMRLFEIKQGGNTPLHKHDWEHEVFILEGEGEARNKEKSISFKPWDFFFVKPNEWHQFVNTGKDTLKFLCLVPIKE